MHFIDCWLAKKAQVFKKKPDQMDVWVIPKTDNPPAPPER
ncbi:hypothetical protein SAMN04489798_3466 [Pseudomonas arsenicoxydans]|uniref:Uncharacterized protein n=1 Tax=Pseudomonas arsenicoxydans TaxID=702115 RepID=A0A1H0L763_9PSED|nr:hypothetical protein SAMN04489798_3466 [Pseudomonas arsenicoxydans]